MFALLFYSHFWHLLFTCQEYAFRMNGYDGRKAFRNSAFMLLIMFCFLHPFFSLFESVSLDKLVCLEMELKFLQSLRFIAFVIKGPRDDVCIVEIRERGLLTEREKK